MTFILSALAYEYYMIGMRRCRQNTFRTFRLDVVNEQDQYRFSNEFLSKTMGGS